MPSYDVVVVGGGICGASIAYELAADHSVCILEQEGQLAYHATGRSAASFVETIGAAPVRALSAASRQFLEHPPAEFADAALTTPLPVLYFSAENDDARLAAFHAEAATDIAELHWQDAGELPPLLRPGAVTSGLLETTSLAIDVHALHQGFIRGLRARGGSVATARGLSAATHGRGGWTLTDASGDRLDARVLVNAGGAWADQVATMAGARPLAITPYRRSVFTLSAPAGIDPSTTPMLIEIDEQFYIKPETGQFLCSPADETPHPAADARPAELEIARAFDLIKELTVITSRHLNSTWGGLRTFAPDRLPVVGFDPDVEGFFWYCGQGGYGVQTSPALSRFGAAVLRGEPLPADLAGRGLDPVQLTPTRPSLRG